VGEGTESVAEFAAGISWGAAELLIFAPQPISGMRKARRMRVYFMNKSSCLTVDWALLKQGISANVNTVEYGCHEGKYLESCSGKDLKYWGKPLSKLRVFMEECAFVKGEMAADKKAAICPSRS
jgi:hypothetical protein